MVDPLLEYPGVGNYRLNHELLSEWPNRSLHVQIWVSTTQYSLITVGSVELIFTHEVYISAKKNS